MKIQLYVKVQLYTWYVLSAYLGDGDWCGGHFGSAIDCWTFFYEGIIQGISHEKVWVAIYVELQDNINLIRGVSIDSPWVPGYSAFFESIEIVQLRILFFFLTSDHVIISHIWVICYCWGNSSIPEGRFSKWF